MEQIVQYVGHSTEDIRNIELKRLVKQVSWVYPKVKIEPIPDYVATAFDSDLALQAIHDKQQEYDNLTPLEQLEAMASSWAVQMLTSYISKNKVPILASKAISDVINKSFLENSDKVDFASVHAYALLLPDGTITQKNAVLLYSIQRKGDEETVDDITVTVNTIISNRTGKTTVNQTDEDMKVDEMPILEALQSLLTPVILT